MFPPSAGRTLQLSNLSLARMPLFHRGGGLVITAAGSDTAGWNGLVLHVWPTTAAFATAATVSSSVSSLVAPPLTRSLYAPSVADPGATAPPVTLIGKTEHTGPSTPY